MSNGDNAADNSVNTLSGNISRRRALYLVSAGVSGLVVACTPAAPASPTQGAASAPTAGAAQKPTAAPPAAATPAAAAPTAPVATPAAAAATGDKHLAFMAGSYESGIVRENLNRFEQQYPGLKVDFTPENDGTYFQKFTVILATQGKPVDVMYVGDEQLASWAEAGWLNPIDGMPGVDQYKKDLFPFNLDAMSYKGKLYGLPYYSDFEIFSYNETMLQAAGFSSPPATWDDVKTYALAAQKAKLVSGPAMVTGFAKTSVNSFQLYWSMVYGAGGDLFDADFNPTFPDKDPAALNALEWIVQAMNDWQILDPRSVELNLDQARDALGAGQALFADTAKYDLQRLNDPQFSPMAGQIKMAPFPKFSANQPGGSLGWARMHGMPKMSKHPDDAWKLQQYAGGKDKEGTYYTAKLWYIQKGLGFGWAPLLDDPEVIDSTKKWGDITLIRKESALVKGRKVLQTPWYPEWEQFFWSQLQDACLKKVAPKDALIASATKATELKRAG